MAGAVAVLPVPGRDGTVVLVVIAGAVLGNGRPNPTTSTAPTPTLPVLPGAGRNVTVEAVWPITNGTTISRYGDHCRVNERELPVGRREDHRSIHSRGRGAER